MTLEVLQKRFWNLSDTSTNWAAINPVLGTGEIGFETDTGQFKIGRDGLPWNQLPYPPSVANDIELVANLQTADATKALAASVGPVLASGLTQAQNTAQVAANSAQQAFTAAATAASTAQSASTAASTAATQAQAALTGLDSKVDKQTQGTLGAGTTVITRALHINRPLIVNQPGATTGVFGNSAASGAVAGDTFYLRNSGAGTFTASGAITALAGYKLTAGTDEAFSADYDSARDAWVSTTPSGGPLATAYSPSIPFDASRYMPMQIVNGPITFTVNQTGAVIGGECLVSLRADGVNTPDFSAFINGGQVNYANVSGQINNIAFFHMADGGYYYAIVLGPAIDMTAPSVVSAVVQNAAPSVVELTFNEALSGTLPVPGAFTVTGHTVASIAQGSSARVINVTLTTPFINGEAARTINYAKPGTNNLKDAAGNETSAFTGQAITNNVGDVTAPLFVSAAVQNAAPSVVEVVFNEPLFGYPTDSNLPVPAAFVVSGHTVSSVTWGSSATMVKLNVTPAFVFGETRTVQYTQPGANNLRDPSGNQVATFGAQSITDNVASLSGTVSVAAVSTAGENLTTAGYSDWRKFNSSVGNDFQKAGVSLLTYAQSNLPAIVSGTSGLATFSWNAGDVTTDDSATVPDLSSDILARYAASNPASIAKQSFSAVVAGQGFKLRVVGACYQESASGITGKVTLRATLSGGGTAVQTFQAVDNTLTAFAYEFTTAGGQGETLTVDVEQAAADNPNQVFLSMVAIKPGT